DPIRNVQIGRDQHEPEIGFRRDHAQSQKLGGLHRANFLDERRERDLRVALLVCAKQLPLPMLDPVKKMETMPALFRDQRSVVLVHRGATGAFAGRGKWARQYSSPSRETRNSRLGSLASVAPQVAHLWRGSDSVSRDCTSKRRRRSLTSWR